MDGPTAAPPINEAIQQANKYMRIAQMYLDRTAPKWVERWLATGVLLALFMVRILVAQGWYIVCYALFIYLLNLFLAFLQPKFDPSIEQDAMETSVEEGGEEGLPTSAKDDEFRPFIRRLPEWKFWIAATRATLIALGCTITRVFDVPVYWPILVVYFFILFTITMRRQIRHMIKYKYVPFDLSKTKYGSSRR
ncbi:retrieval of early ER protein Rer1 [Dacryopinax primogenitus]|uniref:Protein RER1 n=1 Tax=Dacryopinax primogenitus (strain DJM 731) TaxID=1858805 RepID=M5FN28_DACPD|nr:retrieval of early ER protein Rer1 [Dacryopinax primogenitus]EJT96720.1 retrieval of early ER protein Rer1 [Dacryopinax primogenitus]